MTELPEHVAIIMDGNGRWAKNRCLARIYGHYYGKKTFENVVRYAAQRGVKMMSFFAFSTENRKRPRFEVKGLMRLFMRALTHKVNELHEHNIRLKLIGDRSYFSKRMQRYMTEAENKTAQNTGMTVVLAANYGGRGDIVQATQRIAQDVADNRLDAQAVDEAVMQRYLATQGWADPDLLIRTSGEQRISNFFLWQLAYTELYFTDTLWPDFDEQAFEEALQAYQSRRRRFGLLQDKR